MVGVPRSTGCLACRKSKLKCDEVKPLCGRCKKTSRVCEYADKFKFVSETCKQMRGGSSRSEADWPLLPAPRKGIFLYTTERRTKSGGLFQKWHRSAINSSPSPSPSLTPVDVQIYDLIQCLQQGPPGMRFDLIGIWLRKLPQRLGRSIALDNAAHLITSVHGRMIRNSTSTDWLCPESYIRAIRSLRAAILHPDEHIWFETITAASILHHVEQKFGCPLQQNSLHHAGGVSRLLQSHGPGEALKDEFEWQVLGQLQGAVISHSILQGVPCFLSEPEWVDYYDNFEPYSEGAALAQEMSHQLSQWPGLVANVRQLRAGYLSSEDLQYTRDLIKKIRHRLDAIEIVLDEFLANEDNAALVPTTLDDSPFPYVYTFSTSLPISLINLHSAYIFILDTMSSLIDEMTPPMLNAIPTKTSHEAKIAQYQRLVQKVCQCWEYTYLRRPMLSDFISLSLVASYPYAHMEELQQWIMAALNDADAYRKLPKVRFNHSSLEFMNRFYVGAVDIFDVPERLKREQEEQLDHLNYESDEELEPENFEYTSSTGSDFGS